jgi:hypothetical protein
MYRMRNYGLITISQGTGFSVGVDTIVGQNFDKFNLAPYYYYDHWITKDHGMSIVHKLIRMKCFSIFTDFLKTEKFCAMPTRPNLAKYHYDIEFDTPGLENEIDYDFKDMDYKIIKPGISTFADNLVNEIWPFLHIMWKSYGGYKLNLRFRKDWEYHEWGARNAAPLDADYIFEIDANGNWTADFKWDYQQDKTKEKWDDKFWITPQRTVSVSPDTYDAVWAQMDFTRDNSNAAIRARKLAWKGTEKTKQDPFNASIPIEFAKNNLEYLTIRELDYSFKYEWQGKGKWNV